LRKKASEVKGGAGPHRGKKGGSEKGFNGVGGELNNKKGGAKRGKRVGQMPKRDVTRFGVVSTTMGRRGGRGKRQNHWGRGGLLEAKKKKKTVVKSKKNQPRNKKKLNNQKVHRKRAKGRGQCTTWKWGGKYL